MELKAGTFLHWDKKTNWQRTEETQGLYIHTQKQAPGEGEQGGDRQSGRRTKPHRQGRKIWNERRGETQGKNRDKTITGNKT